ncbi:PAS domain S-box protein [Winogradskyella bathintestinalis]|uniref:histidine kinase n=1 Tax=Winogradskyella bathintestinalis TaxID=3035208 RepID=A0ABT7ZXH5_9FLAO|nr:PAS domain S-box protein [Winogradskyella bathintestinalis]MDN3493714.1 PAS domain-containing protein [Winogradskyella bathintestinalis]
MSINTTAHIFLEGGGEMGELIRTKDWSNTPIGNPEVWPEPLKTMVSVLLNNPFGMCIAWGKELTQIYNDGYLPILGPRKHPQALGRSKRDTFSEVWDILGTMHQDVLKGESVRFSDFMLPLDRNGRIENSYFDFSYSPIKLASGDVGGVLVTVLETTHKKKAELNQIDDKNELEFVIEAAKLATYDYNPITNTFACNDRLKNWFGLPANREIELSHALEVIVNKDKQRVTDAIKSALQNEQGGDYDIEYAIINELTKKETIVHARGRAWFNDNNVAYRLTGTLEDVTNRVMARKKIEESERNLKLMILQAPVAISIFRGPDYRVEIANKYALELWGRTEEEVLNVSIFRSMPELASQGIQELLDGVHKTGERFATAERPIELVRNGKLGTIYVNFSYEALYDGKGNINGIMAIGYDVTSQAKARKKIEESEQNIRALVESAPFPIGVYVGEEMRISLANQSIMDAWGKGNNVVGKLYTDILPELDNQEIFNQVRAVLQSGVPFHAVNQRVDIEKDGVLKPYYFNYNFTPLLDASGKTYAVMNTAAEVTELHEARRKVEESEKRFRDSVMQAPLGIIIFRGSDHIVEMANQYYLQIVDRTEEQCIGQPLFKTLPEVKDVIAPIIDDIYKTGDAFYGNEFPINLNRHGKNETTYFNFVYYPLKENNTITGIMVVATEVTATVKAKHLIEENEEKLKLIIEASELGIWDLNLQTQDIVASDRCYDILGFSNENHLTQEKMISHVHPDDLEIRATAFEKAFKTGTLHYQIRIFWEDQTLHWKDVKGKVFYDDDNQPERMLGTVRDITEERNFQQQLLDREEKFRLLADSMPQFIWTSDPEGNLNYFNQSVFDFSGLTLEQIKKDGWLQIVHPDDQEENIREWTTSVNTGSDFLIEHRFRKFDGEYRWQLSRAIPQKDANGVIKMWVGSSTDIQEQKVFTSKLENMVKTRTKELENKNVDLEKMNKELQSFVYISSHDLQEPLRKIQTFASRIKEKELDKLSDNAKSYFSRMQTSAHRMQTLIQDLIAYSRTNVQESTFEIYNLEDIIEDTKETLSEELMQKDVTFELENICDVRIIPVQFQQVILNLVSNSIKFSKLDTPTTIKISCEILKGKETGIASLKKKTTYCHIRFSDNGIGFEQQYHEKIFEVFQRLHSKEEYTGTGIGLAIVKRIIENHEGYIAARSEFNKGAIFDIYLPEA